MINIIRDFWLKNHTVNQPEILHGFTQCKIVKCVDGFEMSVQASATHYCTPQMYLKDGDYLRWEIGFPNAEEPLIMEYVGDADHPTETVYANVPTDVINQVILKHGGLVDEQELS